MAKKKFLDKTGAQRVVDRSLARLATVEQKVNSYTAADVLTKLETVDGSGSGLDADTLDGLQGARYIRTASRSSEEIDLNYYTENVFRELRPSEQSTLNCPISSGAFGGILNLVSGDNIAALQIAFNSGNDFFIRARHGYNKPFSSAWWKLATSVSAFVDLWKAAGGGYDVSTDLFSLNGINDLTYAEAIEIYQSRLEFPNVNGVPMKIRTNMLGKSSLDYALIANRGVNLSYLFMYHGSLEVANFTLKNFNNTTQQYYSGATSLPVKEMVKTFKDCTSLKKILGPLQIGGLTESQMAGAFDGCAALESVLLFRLASNLSLKDCPKLTPGTINYMATYAVNTSPITITVAENVYAKLNFENILNAGITNTGSSFDYVNPGVHEVTFGSEVDDADMPQAGDYVFLKWQSAGIYFRVLAEVKVVHSTGAKAVQINTLEGRWYNSESEAADWDSMVNAWATVKEVINARGNIIIATN